MNGEYKGRGNREKRKEKREKIDCFSLVIKSMCEKSFCLLFLQKKKVDNYIC